MSVFESLESQIDAARWITELQDNWDNEGSVGYLPETLDHAANFLTRHARICDNLFGRVFSPPQLAPADAGSIDLLWENEMMTLLVNIPSRENERVEFYGEDAAWGTLSGAVEPGAERVDLAAWLVSPR